MDIILIRTSMKWLRYSTYYKIILDFIIFRNFIIRKLQFELHSVILHSEHFILSGFIVVAIIFSDVSGL